MRRKAAAIVFVMAMLVVLPGARATGWSPALRTGFSKPFGRNGTAIGSQASRKLTTFKQGTRGISRQQFLGSNRIVQVNVRERIPYGADVGRPRVISSRGVLTERGNVATPSGRVLILDHKTGAVLRSRTDPRRARRFWYNR
jgi:hypothetical protein